jgi:hypothetical protein
MKIIKNNVNKIDLSHLVDNVSREIHKKCILMEAGREHYKLLTYLSHQIQNGIIVELGTHNGTSSLCLCENLNNQVITFDIVDIYSIKKQPSNLIRKIGNIFNDDPTILLKSNLIFLDTSHTGEFELKIYEYLFKNNYKGILLLDDIFFNSEMISFWESIKVKKYDITCVGQGGHHNTPTGLCGTGLVDFSNDVEII